MTEPFVPKIVQLPGTPPSAEVILHRTLTKIDHIKNVVVLIQWNDDSWNADWSVMSKGDFAFSGRILERAILREVFPPEEPSGE